MHVQRTPVLLQRSPHSTRSSLAFTSPSQPLSRPIHSRHPHFAELVKPGVWERWIAPWTSVSKVYASDPLLPIFKIPYRFTLYSPQKPQYDQKLAWVRQDLAEAQTVVIGDLHASFLKLAEVLVAANLITMDVQSARQFVTLSRELERKLAPLSDFLQSKGRLDPFPKEIAAIRDLETKLCQTIQSMHWIGGKRDFIMLGDALGDRWGLDKVMLAMLQRLEGEQHGNITWLASNHDLGVYDSNVHDRDRLSFLLTDALHADQWKREMVPFYHWYLQKSKLMHYFPNTETLLTHAPITDQNLITILNNLHLHQRWDGMPSNYQNLNASHLPNFIQHANQYYVDYVKGTDSSIQATEMLTEALSKFVWTREDEEKGGMQASEFPFAQKGVKVLVHGHDGNYENKRSQSPLSVDQARHNAPYKLINLNQGVRMFPESPKHWLDWSLKDFFKPQEALPLYIE